MHRIVCPLVFAVATAALVGCGPTDKELATMDLPALRQVAEQGEAKAQFILGTVYANGKEVPQNYKQAVAWYQKAAEQGHAEAQYDLGQMYTRGEGVPQDYQQVLTWFNKAAEQGHAKAQYMLGVIYNDGVGALGALKNVQQADVWFSRAAIGIRKPAEQGDASAQFMLGRMYDNGQGVPRDDKQAVIWFRKAAEQGHTAYSGEVEQ